MFGRAFKYGIVVWQCRHAEINSFIQKVLANAKPLVKSGVLEKFVFVSFGKDSSVRDEVVLSLIEHGSEGSLPGPPQAEPLNANDFVQCDVDFKAVLLRLLIRLENMSKFSPGAWWLLGLSIHATYLSFCLSSVLTCVRRVYGISCLFTGVETDTWTIQCETAPSDRLAAADRAATQRKLALYDVM